MFANMTFSQQSQREQEIDSVFQFSNTSRIGKRPSETIREISRSIPISPVLTSDSVFDEVPPSSNDDLFAGLDSMQMEDDPSAAHQSMSPEVKQENTVLTASESTEDRRQNVERMMMEIQTQPIHRLGNPELETIDEDEGIERIAERIGIDLTPQEEDSEEETVRESMDVVTFFRNDAELNDTAEDGQRLKVIFDNMLPVVNDNPVIPEPEEMAEQVICKSKALLTLLEGVKGGWSTQQKKKKLIREVYSICDERCYSEIGYDIKVCEKAIRKAKKTIEIKEKAIQIIDKSIEETEQQRKLLSDSIALRLRQYVSERNELIEKTNKEIEEFNVMYEEYDAICKNLNLSSESVWTEGRE